MKVLLIDDDRFMLALVARILRSFGVATIADAGDAAEAFQMLKVRSYDLIICDLLMEPLSGTELVRLIRTGKAGHNPEVPIIMLTGYTQYRNVAQARNAGVTEVMAKPISPHSLLQHIVHVFDHPRRFIRARNYLGPDRRRQFLYFGGPERRYRQRSTLEKNSTRNAAANT